MSSPPSFKMNNDNQDIPAALREIAAEMKRIRLAVLMGFAVLCFIAGLLMLCYPHTHVPIVACFVAAAGLLPREARAWLTGGLKQLAGFPGRFARGLGRLVREAREEVHRQHSPAQGLPKGGDDTRAR